MKQVQIVAERKPSSAQTSTNQPPATSLPCLAPASVVTGPHLCHRVANQLLRSQVDGTRLSPTELCCNDPNSVSRQRTSLHSVYQRTSIHSVSQRTSIHSVSTRLDYLMIPAASIAASRGVATWSPGCIDSDHSVIMLTLCRSAALGKLTDASRKHRQQTTRNVTPFLTAKEARPTWTE